MAKGYSQSEKLAIITRIQHGESISKISAETSIARSTLYEWVKPVELPTGNQKITMWEINSLRRKVEKYKNIVSILQSADCTVSSPRKDKLATLEALMDNMMFILYAKRWMFQEEHFITTFCVASTAIH